MPDLTLPGTIPGLRRRGSPVIVTLPDGTTVRGVLMHDVEPGPGSDPCSAGWPVAVSGPTHDYIIYARAEDIALDLTDATGRAHAAWWLASAVGLHSPTTSRWSPGASVYTIESDAQSAPWVRTFTSPGSLWSGERVPALADLDPNNDRRLPDGSRQVDAEALRRVVLHVAGVSDA